MTKDFFVIILTCPELYNK